MQNKKDRAYRQLNIDNTLALIALHTVKGSSVYKQYTHRYFMELNSIKLNL